MHHPCFKIETTLIPGWLDQNENSLQFFVFNLQTCISPLVRNHHRLGIDLVVRAGAIGDVVERSRLESRRNGRQECLRYVVMAGSWRGQNGELRVFGPTDHPLTRGE